MTSVRQAHPRELEAARSAHQRPPPTTRQRATLEERLVPKELPERPEESRQVEVRLDDVRLQVFPVSRLSAEVGWSADFGVNVVPLDAFLAECRGFADRRLVGMGARLTAVETGAARTQIPVNIVDLRLQHETWKREFASYCREHHPDVAWPDAEAALRDIAREAGIALPHLVSR